MLNIFANALMIATRLGRLPEGTNPSHHAVPEFDDREGLRTVEMLRSLGR